MQKHRGAQEIRENQIAVARFISTLRVDDDLTQRTCLKEFHKVTRGEIGSDTCIRNMKRILQSQPAPSAGAK